MVGYGRVDEGAVPPWRQELRRASPPLVATRRRLTVFDVVEFVNALNPLHVGIISASCNLGRTNILYVRIISV